MTASLMVGAADVIIRPGVTLHHHHRRIGQSGGGVAARWNGLTAGWHLDEDSDGSAPVSRLDVLGTYDLTDNNTVPSAAGLLSNAASTTKANSEFLSVDAGAGNEVVPFTSGTWFGSIWVNLPASLVSTEYIWHFDNGTNNQHACLLWPPTASSLRCQVYDGTVVRTVDVGTGAGLSLPGWNMITLRIDGDGKIRISANAGTEQVASFALVDTMRAGRRMALSALYHGSNYGTYKTDETYLWNVADVNISDLYNSGSGRAYPN